MAYNQYLINGMLEQSRMETYIQEAIILTEGADIHNKMHTLNEAVGGKLKEIWDKFVAFIKRIFAKFSETMNRVLDTDKGWLEKYANIITKKPYKLTVNCRDYKVERIIQHQIPIFNYSQLQSKLESKGKFMNSIIQDFQESNNTDDLTGWCKAYFCNGKEEEVPLNPNMTDLYNYCHDFKEKTLPRLNQYAANIEKSATNAQSLINSAIRDAANQQQAAAKAESSLFGVPTSYSRLLEIDIQTPTNTNTTSNAAPNTGAEDKKFSSNTPTGTGDGGETKDSAAATVRSNSGLTEDKVNDVIAIYTAVAGAISSSAITVAQWAYNDYMKVLKAHVKMYVADSDTPNQTAATATDYRQGGQSQQQGNTQQQSGSNAAQAAATAAGSQTQKRGVFGRRS